MTSGQIVDRTVRTLRTAAHLTNVQQVRWQGVKYSLIEPFWKIKKTPISTTDHIIEIPYCLTWCVVVVDPDGQIP